MRVAFDIDGTLLDENDSPRWPAIDLLRAFYGLGWKVVVWSGSGVEYAEYQVRRLGIESFVEVWPKYPTTTLIDLAVDDQEVTLGRANIKI